MLGRKEILNSLLHMIEVTDTTLDHIQTNKKYFDPELEQIKIKDIYFYLEYYQILVNCINSIHENIIINQH